MILVPHRPLPLATTSAFTSHPAGQPVPAREWQREWTEAFSRMDARSRVHAGPAAPAAAARPGSARAPVETRACKETRQHALSAGGEPAQPQRLFPDRGVTPPGMGARFAGMQEHRAQADPEAATTSPRQHHARAASVPRPDVQVHVEQEGGQLAIWLGLPGDAASLASRRAAVLSEVMRGLGPVLAGAARVTCNGTVCWSPQAGKEDT